MSNALELVIAVDSKQANVSLQGINRGLQGIEKAAIYGANGASRALDSISQAAQRLAAQVKTVAGIGLAGLGAAAIKIAADFERSRIGIEALIGDAKVAKDLFSDIQAFAERSPFEFSDLLEGTRRLLAFNFAAKDVLPTLESISAAGGALGFDRGKLADLVNALGQIKTAGRLTGEELRQLRNAGIPAMDFLSKAFGRSTAEIENLIHKGLIPADKAIKALTDGMRERFGRFGSELERTTSVALSNFRDAVQRFADDLIRDYLPKITDLLNKTRDGFNSVADAAKRYREEIETIAGWLGKVAAFAVGYRLTTFLAGAADKARNLGTLLAASFHPVGIAVGTIAAFLPRIVEMFQKLKKEWNEDPFLTALLGRPAGIEEAARAKLRDLVPKAPPLPQPSQKGFTPPDEFADKIAKEQASATQRTAKLLLDEQQKGLEGMRKWRSEAEQLREELSSFVDDKGVVHKFRLNAEARANIERLVTVKLYNDLLERQKERLKKETEMWREAFDREIEAFIDAEDRKAGYAREINEEMLRLSQERFRRLYDIEQAQAERARDAALLDLEAVNAQTLRDKLWVEDRKLGIERDYASKALDIQLRKIEAEKQAEIAKWKLKAWLAGKDLDSEEVKGYVREIELTYQQQIDMLKDAASAADIQRAKETEIAKGRIVLDHQRQIYESLKRQAEGVFDALLTKSQSVWSAIGNSLKTALLTAIKDVVSSRVAALLMQLFTGARVSFAGSGSRIGGLLGVGAVPVFAGGAGPIPGGTAGGWSTPPYVPSGPGGWAGLGAGLRNFNWFDAAMLGGSVLMLGGLSRRNALMTVAGASLGLARLGIAGTQLGMVGGAGAGLALAGLMRGGLGGLAMSTAGGAILGWQFGGPIGAAIGAGVGAFAGLFRSLFKSAEDKAREKIKAAYGVDIRDKVVLRQIVEMAKQGFGGNLDMAIRSQQIRDLIELYALSTGQSTSGLPATLRPVSLLQQGGSLFQQASGSMSLDRIGAGMPSSAGGPIVVNITVPGAKEFFEKETVRVVVENPRAVQSAAMAATRASAGRREMTGLQLSPGLVLS